MTVYTFSQARQNFSSLLNKARNEGEVLVKRRDGQLFVIKPGRLKKSPLAVKGIKPFISTKELVETIREQRAGMRI